METTARTALDTFICLVRFIPFCVGTQNRIKKGRVHADGGGVHQAMGGCGLGGVHGRVAAPCVVGPDSPCTQRSVAFASPKTSLLFPTAGSGQGTTTIDEASPHISAAYVLSVQASMEGGGSV